MARISRLLIVLAVMTFGASGFADDWRPTTVVTPYGPTVGNPYVSNPYVSTVGNPYVPAFPSGYYGPAPAAQPGQTLPAPGSQPPAVVGSPCQPNGCFNQDCSTCFDQSCPTPFDQGCRHAPVWGSCEHGALWDCCSCRLGRWYVTADALWLKRNKPNNKTLTIYTPADRIALGTDDLKFDTEAGTRLTFGRYIGPSTSIEGTFFGFHDFDAAATTGTFPADSLDAYWIGSNNAAGAHRTDSFDEAVLQSANYTSEIWNWELGVRRKVSSDGSVLVGFRYMAVDEDFVFRSLDDTPAPGSLGIYEIEAENDLVGLQVGGEQAFYTPGRRLRLTLFGKAGMFVNFHEQSNRLYSEASTGLDPYSSARDNDSSRLSSVFEFGCILTLQLSEHIALRGGYNHIFINGLALATDQLDQAPDRSNSRMFVNDNGSLHLHGPFVGGEFLLP